MRSPHRPHPRDRRGPRSRVSEKRQCDFLYRETRGWSRTVPLRQNPQAWSETHQTPCLPSEARQDHCNEVWKEEGKNKIPRLAFYRKKSAIGGELFRFMGVYTVSIVKHKDGKDCCKWTRISGKFELPEYYRPNNLLHDLQILKQGLGSLPGNKLVQRKRKEIEETRAKIEELVNCIR